MASDDLKNAKVPPQSLEAEQSILGAVLLDNLALDEVAGVVRTHDFYREGHRVLFDAMLRLNKRGEAIDVVTMTEELEKHAELERAGGMQYLMTLAETTPTTANVRSYAAIVREKSVMRRLLEAGGEIVRSVHSHGADAQTLLDEAERKIFEVSGDNSRDAFTPIKDIVTATFRQITELFENPDRYTGLPSGFNYLDEMTGGLQPGDLVIVAARPSMGKTAFCLSLARHAALSERPGKVLVFSLEMSKEQLVKRLLCADGKIDATRLNRGRLGESDWPRLTRSAARISEAPIYIDDTPAISVVELRAKARRLAKREGGLAMVVVDYLQLMRGSSDAETRTLEVGEISRGLKALAKELHVPVVALSQLNRSVEQRPGKRPQLSDLRESGAIEQDADLILFIFREEVYLRQAKEDVPEDVQGMAEIIIGKQRNGPTGVVKLRFLDHYTSFENLDFHHDGAEPF